MMDTAIDRTSYINCVLTPDTWTHLSYFQLTPNNHEKDFQLTSYENIGANLILYVFLFTDRPTDFFFIDLGLKKGPELIF